MNRSLGYNSVLGPDGNPAPLTESQWSEALVGSYDAILATAFRLAPFHPDVFIASKGWKALQDELNMGYVWAPYHIVRTSVLRKGWEVEGGVDDPNDTRSEEAAARADHLRHDLQHIRNKAGLQQSFRSVIWELLAAIHYGFRVTEIVWRMHEEGPYRGKWGFARFAAKPCKQIGFEVNKKTLSPDSFTSYTPGDGFQDQIPVEKLLYYVFAPDVDPYGNGLGRKVYRDYWSIDFLSKFMNLGLQKFGSPNYQATAPQNAMNAAAKAMSKVQQSGIALFPQGVEAQLLQAQPGTFQGFLGAIEMYAHEIALTYELSVLTSGEGQHGATSAGSDVHQDTSEHQHCFVRTDIEDVLNDQLVARWYEYNYGKTEPDLCPRITLGDWDEVDLSEMTKAFRNLTDGGFGDPLEPIWRKRAKLPPLAAEDRQRMEQRQADEKAMKEKQIAAKQNGGNRG